MTPPLEATQGANDLSWQALQGRIDSRFLDLTISEFYAAIEFYFRPPDERQRTEALAVVQDAMRTALEPHAFEPAMLTTQVLDSDLARAIGTLGRQLPTRVPYFTVAYGVSEHQHLVELTPSDLRIRKSHSSTRDLIDSFAVLRSVARSLLEPAAGKRNLLDALGIRSSVYRVKFAFEYELKLAGPGTNTIVHPRLLRLGQPEGTVLSPLASSADDVLRVDVTVSAIRPIGERPRNVWIEYEGPFNEARSWVDLKFQYRVGEGPAAPYQETDLLDWDTPFQGFFVDVVLGQVLPRLFEDVTFASRK